VAFHNVLFPVALSALTAKTSWKNQITELGGGNEQRAILFNDSIRVYDLATKGALTIVEYQSISKHFNARRASGFSYPLRDNTLYKVTVEPLGVGNGSATTFQLTMNEGDAGNAYNREIYLPENGTIRIFDNSVEVLEGAGPGKFTLAYTGATAGLVTFGTAPVNGHVLTWSGQFYIPVRYAIDELPDAEVFVVNPDGTGLVKGMAVPLKEVRYSGEWV
jgi:uncharacterized protein (TIGR02217 family)